MAARKRFVIIVEGLNNAPSGYAAQWFRVVWRGVELNQHWMTFY